MPAQGFRQVDRTDISPDLYGRVWRVNLVDDADVSTGNKDVDSIVLDGAGVAVSRRDGGEFHPLEQVASVLVEEETPPQRTLIDWR